MCLGKSKIVAEIEAERRGERECVSMPKKQRREMMERVTHNGSLLRLLPMRFLLFVLTTTVLMLFAGCMQDIIVLSSRDGTVRYKSSIPTRLRRECVFQVDSANQRFYTYQGNDDEAPL